MQPIRQKPMSRTEWRRTPYSGTSARNTEQAIRSLLRKYGVTNFSWSEGVDQGRHAVMLRFELRRAWYRLVVCILDAAVSVEERLRQAERALFYHLKSALELANVFLPVEEVLFAWREIPGHGTAFQAFAPCLEGPPEDLGRRVAGLLEGPRQSRVVDVEA